MSVGVMKDYKTKTNYRRITECKLAEHLVLYDEQVQGRVIFCIDRRVIFCSFQTRCVW
jgi:hypothetical protein